MPRADDRNASRLARQDMEEILFDSCDIENFGSAAWFHLENQSGRHAIRRSGSRNCNWRSRNGNCPAAGEITVPGHFIYLRGETGPIEDVVVDDQLMDATHIKGGVGLIGDVRPRCRPGGRVARRGQAIAAPSGPDGPGAYALLLTRRPGPDRAILPSPSAGSKSL